MTRDIEDLARLKAALQSPPATDPVARAATLGRAMAAFDAAEQARADLGRQETDRDMRPSQDRPKRAGFLNGVRTMLDALRLKPILTATTSAAALALGLVVFLPQGVQEPIRPAPTPASEPLAQNSDAPAEEALALPKSAEFAAVPAPAPAPSPEVTLQRGRMASPDASTRDSSAPIADAVEHMAEPTTTGAADQSRRIAPAFAEAYANAEASPVRLTAQEPVSTFSVDVDTASYAIIRDALMSGHLPDPEAVRVEEMINYFPYDYPAPMADEAPFRPTVTVMPTPWNPGTRLVHIALQGRMPAVAERPALNLVFLIDTSGSMQDADKLPLLKQSLGLMLGQLRPEDQVAIVAYAGSAGEVLAPTPAAQRDDILAALDRLDAGGSTAGAEGLELAYRTAERMTGEGEVSRILLATDGDFNVGIDDPAGLAAYVARKRDTGVYLSVLGFGRGNLDDAVMQSLAQNGNGTAAYIDTLQEARKVLVDQLTGALFPIADDVKLQVEWNPATVAEYRLIGYETRALRREDFNNDAVDAGEIGAGHQVTALYEVTAPGSPALLNDPLRYAAPVASIAPDATGPELGFLRLRYKAPGAEASALIETPIPAETAIPQDARFAAAVAGFGQLLRDSVYLNGWGWDQAIDLALANRGDDPFGYRAEAVALMRLAQSLAR